jgi:ATP-dependent DNA ligase
MGRADRRRFIVFGRGVVASIERGKVTLYSRNGKIISDSYLPVARALEKLKRDVVIDGELVARDAHGISSFQLLQNALRAEARLLYCIFDIMFCDGEDLRGLALLERKDRLRRILPKHPQLAIEMMAPHASLQPMRHDGRLASRADGGRRRHVRNHVGS